MDAEKRREARHLRRRLARHMARIKPGKDTTRASCAAIGGVHPTNTGRGADGQ